MKINILSFSTALLFLCSFMPISSQGWFGSWGTTEQPEKVKNYYELLGVSEDASQADLRRAYKNLALRYHPDKNPSVANQAFFVKITEAYETLSDANKRAQYDGFLKHGEAKEPVFTSTAELNKLLFQALQYPASTPEELASAWGIALYALSKGANPNQRDEEGCTPLSWAVSRMDDLGKILAALLVGFGADPHMPGCKKLLGRHATPFGLADMLSGLGWQRIFEIFKNPKEAVAKAAELKKSIE